MIGTIKNEKLLITLKISLSRLMAWRYLISKASTQPSQMPVTLKLDPFSYRSKMIKHWSLSTTDPAHCEMRTRGMIPFTTIVCRKYEQAVLLLRFYLEGSYLITRKDHQALQWILDLKESTVKLALWRLRLIEFDIENVHSPGRIHQAAGAISRL